MVTIVLVCCSSSSSIETGVQNPHQQYLDHFKEDNAPEVTAGALGNEDNNCQQCLLRNLSRQSDMLAQLNQEAPGISRVLVARLALPL